MNSDDYEEINHPKHYTHGKYEHAEVAIDWKLGGLLYTVTKHWCRAGHKPGHEEIKDMQKSLWYLNREIKLLETGNEFGLATPYKKIDPADVALDWNLPLFVAFALSKVAHTYTQDDIYMLREAVTFIEQRMDQLIIKS